MAKAKITERVIDTLRVASRRTGKSAFLWDTELRGFGLRVSANGHGTWLVQKWIGGRRGKLKRIAIGYLPPMSVDEARSKARSGALWAIAGAEPEEAELGRLHVSASQTGNVQQEEFGKNPPTPSCRT
jgi:Arm domain-containing DNA-binding protein